MNIIRTRTSKPYKVLYLAIAVTLLTPAILPLTTSTTPAKSFDRGITWQPYTALNKVTLINHQKNTLTDDYNYLAAIPTAVFYDKTTHTLYTNPLLFFDDPTGNTTMTDRFLNTRQGIDYLMNDWLAYNQGTLDQLTTINIDPTRLNTAWNARTTTQITSTDPATTASQLATTDWSYANTAIVAVINTTLPHTTNTTTNTINGTLTPQKTLTQHFTVPHTNEIYPVYNEFTVPQGYGMITVRTWYPCFYLNVGFGGFQGLINMSVPAGDRDLQLYCQQNGQWMMTAVSAAWNAQEGMDTDHVSAYIYHPGKWSIAITDAPTKDASTTTQQQPKNIEKNHNLLFLHFGRYGSILNVLQQMRHTIYQVDVAMYPGTTIPIPDQPPYGCENATITLTWTNPTAKLGFSLLGPSGEEILSTRESGVSTTTPTETHGSLPYPNGTTTNMHLNRLGECRPGEHYSLAVYSETPLNQTTPFTITYSWQQNMTRTYGDSIDTAANAAVLASLLNAPLLYTTATTAPTATTQALTTLGVHHLYIIDLHDTISPSTQTSLTNQITDHHLLTTDNDTYTLIRSLSGQNNIIFSTVEPWTMDNATFTPGPPQTGDLSAGPAAYIAALHGSPVLFIENHPELASAAVYHDELWRRHSDGISKEPSVAEMYLTGTRVYNFLKNLSYDKEGDEIVITVGGQYDIGFSWDRMFVGKAEPGRFFGNPTDLSVWITKNAFYPQLVFQNPGIANTDGVTLINGSSSKRRFPWYGPLGLKITKPSGDVTLRYPALNTLICYEEKFNTRASQYWGYTYKCADGTIPGITQSFDPIDSGDMVAVNGAEGAYFPDLSAPEVQTFYLEQGGYSPVFSTSFNAVMNDLNNGSLLWFINAHGGPANGGILMFWDVNQQNPNKQPRVPLAGANKEENPWRGYEWLMGSTTEPDTMTMQVHGILATMLGNPDPRMSLITTGLDTALAKRPVRDILGHLASLPVIRLITPEWLQNTQDYYDGVVISLLFGRLGTSYYNGTQVDDALGNVHSLAISSVACLPAGKYLHITLMRHGSVTQIMDPWATSWYSDVWQNSVPRGIALGQTIGQIYEAGIKKVGILYISEPPQWWWDLEENVCLYGDPNLRVWDPSTNFSVLNHWDASDVEPLIYNSDQGFSVDGHTPFGTTTHPNMLKASTLSPYIIYVTIGIVAIVLIVAVVLAVRRRRS